VTEPIPAPKDDDVGEIGEPEPDEPELPPTEDNE